MKFEDLLDLPLREVLENYVCVHNLECGYFYGIFKNEDIEKIFQKYNIEEDYPEAFNVENLIDDELIVSYQEPVKDYQKLVNIMQNLQISKKGGINRENRKSKHQ